jgi:hypothetical protein
MRSLPDFADPFLNLLNFGISPAQITSFGICPKRGVFSLDWGQALNQFALEFGKERVPF